MRMEWHVDSIGMMKAMWDQWMAYDNYMRILGVIVIAVLISSVCGATLREKVIDGQLEELLQKIKGKTVAMLTNPTSVDGRMQPLFDRILSQRAAFNITFKCFFAPEHGLRGDQQAGDGDTDYVDPETGVQVYSLYGVRKAPTDAQLQGVDYFIYDIQDVGARYYTYIWSLTYAIEACARNNVEVVVFDRPNPIGRKVEGCPLKMDGGLIGRLLPGQRFTLPQRYGLTVGEFIIYLKIYLPAFKLTVIKMSQWYTIQDNEWVMSSPNIPTLDIVYIYSGLGLLEDTSVSEGRGTTKPFQMTGNPNVNARDIITYFQNNQNTGYGKTFLIRQSYFIPTFQKYVGKVCGGAEVHLTDRENFQSVRAALHMIKAYQSAIKDGSMKFSSSLDKMFGVQGFYQNVQTQSVDSILNDCSEQRALYIEQAKKVWLYNTSTPNISTE